MVTTRFGGYLHLRRRAGGGGGAACREVHKRAAHPANVVARAGQSPMSARSTGCHRFQPVVSSPPPVGRLAVPSPTTRIGRGGRAARPQSRRARCPALQELSIQWHGWERWGWDAVEGYVKRATRGVEGSYRSRQNHVEAGAARILAPEHERETSRQQRGRRRHVRRRRRNHHGTGSGEFEPGGFCHNYQLSPISDKNQP